MASADLLHSPKVHLALGSARDSFDEDTWNHHIGQVRTGQVRASPEFSDGCTTADAAPTTEEIRYASGGYGGRRNVDWNANHFSEVGMSGLGPQSPQPDPHAASMSASFGAAGIGGVDDGGRWPTLTNWSARKDTHVRAPCRPFAYSRTAWPSPRPCITRSYPVQLGVAPPTPIL
jgi:hypothetical protein